MTPHDPGVQQVGVQAVRNRGEAMDGGDRLEETGQKSDRSNFTGAPPTLQRELSCVRAY